VGIPARLVTVHGTVSVDLINLSRTGARIDRAHVPKVREAMLVWLGFEAMGELVWREGQQLGMTFDAPLSIETMIATREQAATVVDDALLDAAREWAIGGSSLGAGGTKIRSI